MGKVGFVCRAGAIVSLSVDSKGGSKATTATGSVCRGALAMFALRPCSRTASRSVVASPPRLHLSFAATVAAASPDGSRRARAPRHSAAPTQAPIAAPM
eukprot:scaffold25333_cov31-Tisochrysis_lutea.AAC.1